MATDEKREHPRYTCFQTTFYSTRDGLYEGVIRDKDKEGVKGVFIATDEHLLVGQVVTVAIPASGEEKGKKLKGVIVRREAGGVGVHFKSLLNE
jgi:hypothetical protein